MYPTRHRQTFWSAEQGSGVVTFGDQVCSLFPAGLYAAQSNVEGN
jgi:hypothetical protein